MPPAAAPRFPPVRRFSLAAAAALNKAAEKALLAKIFGRQRGRPGALDRRLLVWLHLRMVRRLELIRHHRPATPPAPDGAAGVHNARVALAPSDPAWRTSAATELAALRAALDPAAQVQHIGSTAIEDLVAKPILDLAVVLPPERFDATLPPTVRALQDLGYRFVGIRGGCFFEKGRHPVRTHALQIHPADSLVLADLLRFRARLVDEPDFRADYAAIKASLADLFPRQRVFYAIYKSHWIDECQWRHSGIAHWSDWFVAQEREQVRLAEAMGRLSPIVRPT